MELTVALQVGKDPDLSHMDHHWRASTLESCGDHLVTCSLDPHLQNGMISYLITCLNV